MAQYNHLPVFRLAYDLTLDLHRCASQFPRAYRYTLGEKLKLHASDLLAAIVAANSRADKAPLLDEATATLEILRIHVRIACDLKILGIGRYESLSRTLEEIARQLCGWAAWAKASLRVAP